MAVNLVKRPKVTLDKRPVDGKRPGDAFTRGGTDYTVVRVSGDRYWTESEFGREAWFTAPVLTSGKFDSDRDAVLHLMSLELWANDSDGDVSAPEGYFARISNSPAEIAEIRAAFADQIPEDFAWSRLVGKFLLRENDQGFVTVTEYVTDAALERNFNRLRSAYLSDIDF